MDSEKYIYPYYGTFHDHYQKKNGMNSRKKEDMNNFYDKYDEYIKTKHEKGEPIYFRMNHHNKRFCIFNNLQISYQDFPWESYILMNDDLRISGVSTKDEAWNHWIHCGKKEERAFSVINNTNNHNGRFGNLFFVNMYLHFLSLKFDLKCNYKLAKKFEKLGVVFYQGKQIYEQNVLITETNYLPLLTSTTDEPSNVIINNKVWFQSNDFCLLLKDYFNKKENKNAFIEKNIYKKRYKNNDDLFIHVRLGDITHETKCFLPYYEKMLTTLSYKKGYIASDSIESDFCKYLITRYRLTPVLMNETETIMLGSTCNKIVLSGGSFSWLIGFFAFYSEEIYYPDFRVFTNTSRWFGDIFHFSNWKCVLDF